MTSMSEEPDRARRNFLIGAGAVAGLAAASVTDAEAGPAVPSAASGAPMASPIPNTIASPPVNGRVYRIKSMFDFTAEGQLSQRAWDGFGVYTANSSSTLWSSIEIPPGALVRDIEWYVRNGSGAAVNALGRLWAAGNGFLTSVVADVDIAPNADITATRVEVPEASWGPFPLGTRLLLGITTPTTATVQINGVRVGLSDGAGQLSVRNKLAKVYNTKQGPGKFSDGETRTFALPEVLCAPGTVAVILNITALEGGSNGTLKVYSANGTAPFRTMSYGSQPATQMITVAIPKNRKIKIEASKAVHLLVELAGTVS